MEHITKGHWIFAALFAVGFIGFLIWSYRKDLNLHKIHYKGSSFFLLTVILIAFLLYVFRGLMN